MADERTVTPERWTARGEAVASHSVDDRPLMIWGGVPGEEGRVKVVHRGRNQVQATWIGARKHHPTRVNPPCDRYEPCGGCPLMHVSAEGQYEAHRSLVRAALDGQGLEDVEVGEVFPSPDGLEDFRHVVKVGVGYSDIGRIKVGAWGRGSRNIVPVPQCNVAAPVLNKVMVSLAHHIIDMQINPYEPEKDRGILRSAVIRASRTTGEVLVTLIAGRRTQKLLDLAEAVGQGCSEIVGVWLHLNSEPGNAIYVRDDEGNIGVQHLLGKDYIEERVGEVTYRIGPGDFFQTNPAMAEVLYQRTIERLAPRADDAVVDLYCGVGGIALQAATKAGFVIGVEEVEGAVNRAREVARLNRLNAEFVSDRVEAVLPDLQRRLDGVRPLVTVNPARRGLEATVVEGVLALKPSRIAYVSCNPEAMARDLALLRDGGDYEIDTVELFEMFPNTAHVECLVVLESRDEARAGRRAPRRKVLR